MDDIFLCVGQCVGVRGERGRDGNVAYPMRVCVFYPAKDPRFVYQY